MLIAVRIACAVTFLFFMLSALSLNHWALENYGMLGLIASGASIMTLLLGILWVTKPPRSRAEEW